MKKIYQLTLLFVLFFSISSCNKLEFEYAPTNSALSFEKAAGTYTLDGKDIIVNLHRGGNVDSPLKVDIELEAGSVYTMAGKQAVFEAGKSNVEILLTYNPAELRPTIEYTFSLKISDDLIAELSPAGIQQFKGIGELPLIYENYAEMSYKSSAYLGAMMGSKTATLQKAKGTDHYFRILNLYDAREPLYLITDLSTKKVTLKDLEMGYTGDPEAAYNPDMEIYIYQTGLIYKSKNIEIYPRVNAVIWSKLSAVLPKQGDILSFNMWATNGSEYINNGYNFEETYTVKSLY